MTIVCLLMSVIDWKNLWRFIRQHAYCMMPHSGILINRLYYACFYSASALLLYKHIIAKSHSGVIGQFSENMVRTGIFSVDEFRVYAKLLNWRSKGDYNDFFDFSKEDVDSMMRPTKHFIDKVVALIEL